MRICHIALQGCLTLHDPSYGLTADTGGHIRYLLGLARASAADPAVEQVEIVTRGFRDPALGAAYHPGVEDISGKIRLIRLDDGDPRYLAKEQLHERHDALAEAFLAHLAQGPPPTLIHAHYADAGILARHAHERLGIPYIFTGHSLGAVKRQANGAAADAALEQRMAIEERALEAAHAVIASSRDEAEAQYAHYRAIEPGRIRVIPPGCELDRFSQATPTDRVRADIARFLRDPAKPMVLAIARPVRKKNLLALVDAFAGNRALRESANLVLVVGCRGLLGDLERECAEVVRELIEAIDRHDLYGSVAYPKRHAPEDIPAYYALARETGGVFVNPALNEPFGLTLLEAAAARLPVVATDSGGPNDIVERCRNGRLVCPTDRAAIGAACLAITGDRHAWMRHSTAGVEAVRAYDWTAHRTQYHDLVTELTEPERPPMRPRRLLVCDIDNTLLGDRAALRDFLDWQGAHCADTALGIATGRSFNSAQAILSAEGVPTPDVIVSSVGTAIHWYDRERRRFVRDEYWHARMARDWDGAALLEAGAALGLTPQSALEQKPGKASFFRGEADLASLPRTLAERGFDLEVICSHDRYVDLLPRGGGKGAAVLHVAENLHLTQARVIVAGDSGNDLAMLRSCPHPIVVGNFSDGLATEPSLGHAYIAKASHAAGILEGVRHYRAAGVW